MADLDTEVSALDPRDRGAFKADRWRRSGTFKKIERGRAALEVGQLTVKDGRIEVFARAWWNGRQIGFGRDGTVDLERFVFGNPPVLVADPSGEVRRVYEADPEEDLPAREFRYRVSPRQALIQRVIAAIRVKKLKHGPGAIIKDKVGNTTLVESPETGDTEPYDGRVIRSTSNETWATIVAGNGTTHSTSIANSNTVRVVADVAPNTDRYTTNTRSMYGFDTSSIGSDDIDSAVFSWRPTFRNANLGTPNLTLVSCSPSASLANSDYQNAFGSTEWATGIGLSALTLNSHNDWTLNASGEAGINKSGNTYLGLVFDWDLSLGGAAPTWVSGAQSRAIGDYVDKTGTADDPYITIEHSAAAGGLVSPLAGHGGLAGPGGLAGRHGGLAG